MTRRAIDQGRAFAALAVLSLMSCLADEPGRGAPDALPCARGGQACPDLPGHEVLCVARTCVARNVIGERFGDCDGSGRYAVPLDQSDANCGACGRRCDDGSTCTGGACFAAGDGGQWPGRAPCEFGTEACGLRCVDTATNPEHCGGCGRRCVGDEVCLRGGCVRPCPLGQSLCGGACVDLRVDAAHCGACGIVCPLAARCDEGRCACPEGSEVCNGACVDVRSSAAHCGGCGRRCPEGMACVAGACGCVGGWTRCGGACVDVSRDRAHCGACGQRCAPDTLCLAGACAGCPAGETRCGESCVLADINRDHCGTCGNACWYGGCDRGRCATPCSASFSNDAFLGSSDDHCGACGTRCAVGELCLRARCVRASPRLVAPISTSVVTSARPWLRWKLPPGAEGARVELCDARPCERVVRRWDAAGEALRVPEPLPAGVYFWRALALRGAAVAGAPGVVWEFVVPEHPGAADAPPGPRVDFNGDGLADRFTLDTPPGAAHANTRRLRVFLGTAGPAPTTPDREVILEGSTAYTLTDGWLDYGPAYAPVYASDLNGDGYGDLVLCETQPRGMYRLPHIEAGLFLGGPEGFPRDALAITTGWYSPNFALHWHAPAGDVDGDGYGDLTGATNGIRLYGGRAVAFGPGTQFSTCAAEVPHLAGDFNADGASEIVSAPCGSGGSAEAVAMVRPSFPGAWEVSIDPYPLGGCGVARIDPARWADAVRVADDDADGFDDLILWTGRTATERAVFRGGAGGLVSGRCVILP
ncbi:MAG: hypothetical protein U0324_25335 [Polyangiales bacterium]